MNYALDTSACIDFFRGKLPRGYEFLQNSDSRLFKIPVIVEAELRLGVEKSAQPEKVQHQVEKFLLAFDILSFDSQCSHEYARIRAALEKQGKSIGNNDLLIAATALAHNLILITQNVDEFKRVPGLQLESWHELAAQE